MAEDASMGSGDHELPFRAATPDFTIDNNPESILASFKQQHRNVRDQMGALYDEMGDVEERILERTTERIERAEQNISDSIGNRIKPLEDAINALAKAGNSSNKRSRNDGDTTDGESGSNPLFTASARDRPVTVTSSYPPPIEQLFGFMDEKHLKAALRGTLKPELLATVINPSHHLHRDFKDKQSLDMDTTSEGAAILSLSNSVSEKASMKKFMAGIPNALTFSHAWDQLSTLILHGMGVGNVSLIKVKVCLGMYSDFITDSASRSTWESICRFHIRSTSGIFRAGASNPDAWSTWDKGSHTSILVALPSKPSSSSSRTGQSSRPTDRPKSAVCRLYNSGYCKAKVCPRGRRHACSSCGQGHPVTSCKA